MRQFKILYFEIYIIAKGELDVYDIFIVLSSHVEVVTLLLKE